MSSIIKLLERMGQDSTLTDSKESSEKAINKADINNELKQALINKDVQAIVNQLDVCPDIYCLLFPADEEEAEEKPAEDKTEIAA
ncbi:hypothetical protein L2737_00235 [Shewanella electrodiphila]|uniref:Uncharacterized protein n=1 Tax=Shewanella electrodiphila TaxID=934143 RepID=A0ABT0KJM1_9GAMM|nr:hypothetical protein [Shewanella electrodiphila]MCL1043766.1 hypothetical protein [Shewanella electrodiphila]